MFRAKRQGIELSMNAIIIMALGLIILIIGAYMIIKSVGQANVATNCPKDGKCQATCDDTYPMRSPFSCSVAGQICCVPGFGINVT